MPELTFRFGKKLMAMNPNWQQERLFASSGPFIHLCTSPLEKELLMENDEDRTAVLNMIALTSRKCRTDVLAYALMSNHIHLLLQGDEIKGHVFYDLLYKRLARYLVSRGKTGCINGVTCSITPITTLRQFRDELAYIIRNPFVVRNDVHLFAYRWCSGYLYFNAFLSKTAGRTAAEISYRERRLVTRSSAEEIPADFRIVGTLILPESFVNYRLAEQLFESVRQFLHWTLKNVEAQVEVAHSHGEHPQLSDDELFIPSRDLCERLFGTRQPKELTYQQKKEYVMALRKAYGASNGQLARLGSLPLADVNTMYPLSAKG